MLARKQGRGEGGCTRGFRDRESTQVASSSSGPSRTKRKSHSVEKTLVPVTREALEELREALDGIIEKAKMETGESGVVDAGIEAYLSGYRDAVMESLTSSCEIKGVREQREADELMESVLQLNQDMQDIIVPLKTKRARVMRLAEAARNKEIEASRAREKREEAENLAGLRGAASETGVGGKAEVGGSALGEGGVGAEVVRSEEYEKIDSGGAGVSNGTLSSALDESVLKTKLSGLIGVMADTPGPLKSLLQEIPERKKAIASTLRTVHSSLASTRSMTEELLQKLPSAGGPVGKGRRAERREAKSEQARRAQAETGPSQLAAILGK
ncbi:unnamed protein product [Choristocarpus tenellus]